MVPNPTITFTRPNDTSPRSIPIYIRGKNALNMRAHNDIVGMKPTISTLMATSSPTVRRASTLAKCIHGYTHAPRSEMIEIFPHGGYASEGITKLCKDVVDSCQVCTRSGQPAFFKSISVTHVSQASNQELQADFMF